MTRDRSRARFRLASLFVSLFVVHGAAVLAQTDVRKPPQGVAGPAITATQLNASIQLLGSFDFPVRMEAGRTVRRAEPALAVPALIETVSNTAADWYVRFRALVLLSGFNDARTGSVMQTMLQEKNDRLRAVAYAWFERQPDPSLLPRLLAAADREESEFVRPALTRALAAHAASAPSAGAASGGDVRKTMTRLVMSGQDIFRAAVIEVLGEHRAAYAIQPIMDVAKVEGPLQDDAILALGRIGDKRGLAVLADLQRTAPRHLQPTLAASICLLGSNCVSHQGFLVETLTFAIRNPGYQELVRSAAGGLAALAIAGQKDAARLLFDMGVPTRDPERAPLSLAIGNLALRNATALVQALEARSDLAAATELLRDAFDMLDEDLEEERFFATVRRMYWAAQPGSPSRKVAEMLIQRLEF